MADHVYKINTVLAAQANLIRIDCPECGEALLPSYHPGDDLWHCLGKECSYSRVVSEWTPIYAEELDP